MARFSLEEYVRKRDFARPPEPLAGTRAKLRNDKQYTGKFEGIIPRANMAPAQ